MVKLFILVLFSFFFTALSIYAECGLPTGGACSIDKLKSQQQIQENSPLYNIIKKNTTEAEPKVTPKIDFKNQKDLQEQADLEKLNEFELED